MFELLLFFAWGFFVKLTDEICDNPGKIHSKARFLFAAVYGTIAGFAVSVSAEFSAIVLAMVLGVLLAGKIDTRAHQIGIVFIFGSALFFGVTMPNIFLVFLLAATFLDEFLSLRHEIKNKNLKKFLEFRSLLPLTAAIISIATWNAIYIIAIVLFDAGYRIAKWIYGNFSKKL